MASDLIVTVRMPDSLIEALKSRTTEQHYADLSEQIRSIVRKGCLRFDDPVQQGIHEIKERLATESTEQLKREQAEQLVAMLQKLLGDQQ